MTNVTNVRRNDVIVIHETNGRKYLEALVYLQRREFVGSLRFFEASIAWKFLHSVVREKRPIGEALRQASRNLRFRFECMRVRGKVVVIALPPWDVRFLYYARMRRHNHVVYNTSWPHWRDGRVPRKAGLATAIVRGAWIRALGESRVSLTAVTDIAGAELGSIVGRSPAVVPHVVSEVFFEHRAAPSKPFRLVFVGDLVEQRGLATLRDAIALLAGEPFALDIVGDGPLRQSASELARETGGTWHGRVADRAQLARIVSSAHLLVSPSIRTERWEELFGMAILEAMACGVPCIASDHVGPRAIIDHGRSGVLLPEKSPALVAEWIRRLMHDDAAWSAMSAAARARAERSRVSEVAAIWASVFARDA